MDEVMEDAMKSRFLDQRIDLDYEFDAARYFDFARPESYLEAQEAESWFESAGSYPPSPFVIKLHWSIDVPLENSETSQNSKDGEKMNYISNDSDNSMGPEMSELDGNYRGLNSHNHMAQDTAKAKAKSLVRSSSRSSTLMKPTASYLAKQNQYQEVYSSRFQRRFQKPFVKFDEKSSHNPLVIESQATKRQKLESGFLRKVAHLKHHTLFVHKVSKKVGQLDMNSACVRSKVTIPREPDLKTAHRAQRHRPKNNANSGDTKLNACSFKARPLNRKILEAPSLPPPKKSTPQLPEFQEFHLKTSERAMQHTVDNVVTRPDSNSRSQNGTMDSKRPNSAAALNQEKCDTVQKFKARPFNKKILSSRGELAAFRNIKQEATIPLEFKFPTDERFSHNPPIELFNKLSLTSEAKTNAVAHPKPPLSTGGSKENAPVSFNQQHGMTNGVKDKPQRSWGKQNQCGSDWMIPEIVS
ncbi:hypothetical protein L1049_021290 [Liquidambar formosana]|uniref:TPX2 central domain-containing protein n=1 Tax=Liquidambar formosana TaxID=63359 RepID=A0AAP0S919_LIQFO